MTAGIEKIKSEAKIETERHLHEYMRGVRLVEMKAVRDERRKKKFDIIRQLMDKSSEMYGSTLKNGRNPNRRHFCPRISTFSERMADLDVDVNFEDLSCSFAQMKRIMLKKKSKYQLSEQVLDELYKTMKVCLFFENL